MHLITRISYILLGLILLTTPLVLAANADDYFQFELTFEDEKNNEYILEGRIDDDKIYLTTQIIFEEFRTSYGSNDEIKEIDISVQSTGFSKDFDEKDDEIRTIGEKGIELDLDEAQYYFVLGRPISFDFEVEKKYASDRLWFDLTFDVDEDVGDFEIQIEDMKIPLIRNTFEGKIDNRYYDTSNSDFDVRDRGNREVEVLFEKLELRTALRNSNVRRTYNVPEYQNKLDIIFPEDRYLYRKGLPETYNYNNYTTKSYPRSYYPTYTTTYPTYSNVKYYNTIPYVYYPNYYYYPFR